MTHAEDLIRILRILEGAPIGGMSIDDIQQVTKDSSDPWSYRTINGLLCALGHQITHEKVRIKTGKVTRFKLKGI